jgi:glutathione-regulated potassium-efflux system ancillary protein KefG
MNRPDESEHRKQTTQPILVLFAHPALQKSRVNRRLIQGLDSIEGVTFHDLYESYPDLCIDVNREQELLVSHEVVIFQHPFFWYSTPSILKEWQDLVLEHGWAYGSEGTALHNKTFLSVVTTGGKESAYRSDGFNRHTVRQLLAPIEQTAYLCGMKYLAPFIAHGTHRMNAKEMARYADDYHRLLLALYHDRVDLDKASERDLPFINQDLTNVIKEDR